MSIFTSSHHELEVEAAARDAAKLAGLRQRAEARRERFLDPHLRTAGRDEEMLQRQIAEKQFKYEQQRAEEEAEMREFMAINEAARSMERETSAVKAKAASELLDSLEAQMKSAHLRTTADLEGKAPERPVAKEYGVSAAQVFDGEDPFAGTRAALQGLQRCEWSRQAELEKLRKKREEEEAKRAENAETRRIIAAAEELDRHAQMERLRRDAEVKAENRRLHEEKTKRDAAVRAAELRADEESLHTMNNPGVGAGYHFLAGSLKDAEASFSSTRYRVDHYRGAPPAFVDGVTAEQRRQMAEKEAVRQRQIEEEAAQAADARKIAATARALERAAKQEKTLRDAALLDALQAQADAAKQRRREEEEARRGVRVSDDFFRRFGSSDR